jgi:hypothetical protein
VDPLPAALVVSANGVDPVNLAVEISRVLPASGNLGICGQQFWLGPNLGGVTVRLWIDTTVHILRDDVRLKPKKFAAVLEPVVLTFPRVELHDQPCAETHPGARRHRGRRRNPTWTPPAGSLGAGALLANPESRLHDQHHARAAPATTRDVSATKWPAHMTDQCGDIVLKRHP